MKTTLAKRNNKGKRKWSLVDFKALEPMIQVLEYGRDKYSEFKNPETGEVFEGKDLSQDQREQWERVYDAADNWKKGFNGFENMESAIRHLVEYMSGTKDDDESGLPHLGHLMCCIMFEIYHNVEK